MQYDIPELINRLGSYGVKLWPQGNRLGIYRPKTWKDWYDAPKEAQPLLGAMKKHRKEIINYIAWDEAAALKLFREMLAHIGSLYIDGALQWAEAKKPELWQAINKASEDYDKAFIASDMLAVRKAVQQYETAVKELLTMYSLRN